MQGSVATIADVELHLEDLVLPVDLLSNESLSLDDVPEEEHLSPFKVDSCCEKCHRCIRTCVIATTGAISALEQLLLSSELSFLCAGCAKSTVRNGRSF
ncbi:E7 [Gammapapillomavirus 9]|uniref:Protein E7 n=2 Tax=Papillomaviridae TaxID=151340 RepID=A0A3R5T6P2_9PAPI|nr:E7 [Gammapapillomavirus 9]QAB13904.1 MAG: E7 protein [Human papillomavirus]